MDAARHLQQLRLHDGKPVFGCFMRFPDPTLVDFVAYHGWDFLIFDGEHGAVEPRECENLVRAAERGFVEILELSVNCRFKDCRHMEEPGCAVRTAVVAHQIAARRYESYRRLCRLYEKLAS